MVEGLAAAMSRPMLPVVVLDGAPSEAGDASPDAQSAVAASTPGRGVSCGFVRGHGSCGDLGIVEVI
jgi:hypothetical protein